MRFSIINFSTSRIKNYYLKLDKNQHMVNFIYFVLISHFSHVTHLSGLITKIIIRRYLFLLIIIVHQIYVVLTQLIKHNPSINIFSVLHLIYIIKMINMTFFTFIYTIINYLTIYSFICSFF